MTPEDEALIDWLECEALYADGHGRTTARKNIEHAAERLTQLTRAQPAGQIDKLEDIKAARDAVHEFFKDDGLTPMMESEVNDLLVSIRNAIAARPPAGQMKSAEEWHKEIDYGCGIAKYSDDPNADSEDVEKHNIHIIERIQADALAAQPPSAGHADTAVQKPEAGTPDARLYRLTHDFAEALLKKLRCAEKKYGHKDSWLFDDWEPQCQSNLLKHLYKGDPIDVAAYCAFMWYHKWPTVAHVEQKDAISAKQPTETGKKKEAPMIKDANDAIREFMGAASSKTFLTPHDLQRLEEIINDLLSSSPELRKGGQWLPTATMEKAKEALEEIAEGRGRYSEDVFKHACNTIEDMKEKSRGILALLADVKKRDGEE